jgi:hypothetical protein
MGNCLGKEGSNSTAHLYCDEPGNAPSVCETPLNTRGACFVFVAVVAVAAAVVIIAAVVVAIVVVVFYSSSSSSIIIFFGLNPCSSQLL